MFAVPEIDSSTLVAWLQEDKPFRLIDVRSDGEIARGVIPRGEALPLHLLPIRAGEIDAETPVVFYCRTGARSAQACAYMSSQGHHNVYNLSGGIVHWARQGLPIVTAGT